MAPSLHAAAAKSFRLHPIPGHTKRDFLTLHNLSIVEFNGLLDLAEEIKLHPESYRKSLAGKSLAVIFEKPSLRTRLTFEAGMGSLGGHSMFVDQTASRIGARESLGFVRRINFAPSGVAFDKDMKR